MSAHGAPTTAPNPLATSADRSRINKTWGHVLRFARRKPLGFIGGVMVIFYLVIATLSPYIAPYSATSSIALPLQAPSSEHWFGTDSVGRDMFSRVLVGSQVSLAIGFSVMLISITVSTILGMISGYYLGVIDYILQRSGEAFQAFPTLILYFAIIAMFGRPSSEGGSVFQVAWDLRVLILALSVGAIFGDITIKSGATSLAYAAIPASLIDELLIARP
jgi:ABC-type dipeptide/oligopeptide/nickel transport system permease subunit